MSLKERTIEHVFFDEAVVCSVRGTSRVGPPLLTPFRKLLGRPRASEHGVIERRVPLRFLDALSGVESAILSRNHGIVELEAID